MKKIILILFVVISLLGCESYEEVNDTTLKEAILSGDIIHIEDYDDEYNLTTINNIVVGKIRKSITYDCFGAPSCVSLDENYRALVRTSTDDFAFWCGDCTGITYFSTNYYNPYWYNNLFPPLRGQIQGSGYLAKIIAFCLLFPAVECSDYFD